MALGIKFTVISKETYNDLRLLLDTLEGIPFDCRKDINYREAIRLIVDRYESENVGLLNPSNEV